MYLYFLLVHYECNNTRVSRNPIKTRGVSSILNYSVRHVRLCLAAARSPSRCWSIGPTLTRPLLRLDRPQDSWASGAVAASIRNTLNSIGWDVVRMDFPVYLRRVLGSYLNAWTLHSCDDDTCGVSRGSVLGPLLWTIEFDPVFRLPLPRGTTTVGDGRIRESGLQLAAEKTRAVVFKVCYGPADLRLRIQGQTLKYSSVKISRH